MVKISPKFTLRKESTNRNRSSANKSDSNKCLNTIDFNESKSMLSGHNYSTSGHDNYHTRSPKFNRKILECTKLY